MNPGDAVEPLPRVLAVVGPTAAGKGALGRALAARLGRAVFVCDSVKVYRGLDIGSAKPDAAARAAIRHELIDLVDPDMVFSAWDYASAAWALGPADAGVFVGGTGFYLRALAWTHSGSREGAHEVAPDNPERRAFEDDWRERERQRSGALHQALMAADPATAATIHPANLVRTLRALWLCEQHGRAISQVRNQDPPRRRCHMMMVVLDPGPEELAPRIEQRVDVMLQRGWLGEVENLASRGYHAGHKAMQSLGYRQLLDVVQGRADLSSARAAIIAATRQYAKRQRTYFRHQPLADVVVPIRRPSECPWQRIEAFVGGHGARS